MRGKWLLFSGTVILMAIAAGALSVLYKPAVKEPEKKAAAPQGVQPGDEIALNGTIQAAHVVTVRAPVDGTIDSWDVQTGQDVLEGQVLGRVKNTALESAQQQAQMELDRSQTRVTNLEGSILAARLEAARAEADATRTKAEVELLERTYTREQMQFKEGALARLKFEKTEKAYKAAREEAGTAATVATQTAERVAKLEKDLELAKKALEERTAILDEAKEDLESAAITSPVDGTVLALKAEAGGEVSRNMLDLVQLAVDPAILDVVVQPEADALKLLQPGQPALVIVPEVTSEGLMGEVKQVKEKEAVVEFTSPSPAIKHGMQAGVRIKLIEAAPQEPIAQPAAPPAR